MRVAHHQTKDHICRLRLDLTARCLETQIQSWVDHRQHVSCRTAKYLDLGQHVAGYPHVCGSGDGIEPSKMSMIRGSGYRSAPQRILFGDSTIRSSVSFYCFSSTNV